MSYLSRRDVSSFGREIVSSGDGCEDGSGGADAGEVVHAPADDRVLR